MANELDITYPTAGTFYAIVRRVSDGTVWNGTAFEAWVDGNIANYDLPLTSFGGDYYATNFPATIVAGDYRVFYYKQAGGVPAISDILVASEDFSWTGTAQAFPTSGGTGTMTLTDARVWVRQAATDSDSTRYSDTDVDRAIAYAGEAFCRRTKFLKRSDNVALAALDAGFPLSTAAASGFRPERVLSVYLAGFVDPLTITDYESLNNLQSGDPLNATPQLLAFLDDTHASVWPTPDIPYVAKLRWWEPFSAFTPGTLTPNSVILNLPNDVLPSVLSDGAAGVLTQANKKDKFGVEARARFEAYILRMMGAGNLGAKVIYRQKIS